MHAALKESGITPDTSRKLDLFLKDEFKEKPFFKTGFVFKNERVKYEREDVTGIHASFIETTHEAPLLTGFSQSSTAFEEQKQRQANKKQQDYLIKSFGSSVVRKALSKFPEYQFSNLKQFFPHLKSISEFIESESYLGKLKIEVEGSEHIVKSLSQGDKLDCVIRVLEKLSNQLQAEKVDYKGTKEFKHFLIKDVFTKKTLNIVNDGKGDKETGIAQSETTNSALQIDLSDQDWFAFNENYGSNEEKYLVKYIAKVIEQLKKKYSEVYLLRNERHFKIFNFDDGRAFEPDFVLFLIKENESPTLHYQVFIEPKGQQFIKGDEWKHNFLMQLKSDHKIEQLWSDRNYIIWGMPFYNETETKPNFEKEFSALL